MCGDLNRLVPASEQGQGEGKEPRLVLRFLSQMIRLMEAIRDDGSPEKKTDLGRKIMSSVLGVFI